MPNRVLTDDEILMAWGESGLEPMKIELIKFGRRIESLIINKSKPNQAGCPYCGMNDHLEGSPASDRCQERVSKQDERGDCQGCGVRPGQAHREYCSQPSSDSARQDTEYSACPHNRYEVCAECRRVIAEGAEDGMGGGQTDEQERLRAGSVRTAPARHPSDSLAQDEEESK